MEETKLKTPASGSDPIVKTKIDLKGNHAATPGGKGEKRDATSPPIPPKPQLEKKTREEPSGDAKARVTIVIIAMRKLLRLMTLAPLPMYMSSLNPCIPTIFCRL